MKEHRTCSVELFCSAEHRTEQNTKTKFLTEHRTEQNTNFCFPKNIYARLALCADEAEKNIHVILWMSQILRMSRILRMGSGLKWTVQRG